MLMHAHRPSACVSGRGFVLLEVLISIVILSVGLLGLAKLQGSTRQLQMESYQRAQAVVLLQDMVSRLSANSKAAGCYAISDITSGAPYLGSGGTVPTTCAAGTGTSAQQATATQDLTDWNDLLQGASEQETSGVNAGKMQGAMIDARGCVSYDATNNVYIVTVVWQGLMTTTAPAKLNCGISTYPDDKARRAVSAVVLIPTLS
jgi:type IV pilus assembly protein PilV